MIRPILNPSPSRRHAKDESGGPLPAAAQPTVPRAEPPPALGGERVTFHGRHAGLVSFYVDGPLPTRGAPPLVLIHSISAASSAYDMQPLYDHYRATRRVIALDLPGFGFSARVDRPYTPRLMTDAIKDLLEHLRLKHGQMTVDAIALSLSAEFLARAATEQPGPFRTLVLVSPTGFEHRALRKGRPQSTRGNRWVQAVLNQPRWRRGLYELLTKRSVIRLFLRRTWGSAQIDAGLFEYDVATSRPTGAEFAPISFLAGGLFSNDSGRLYLGLRAPVLLIHGRHGAFAKFPGTVAVEGRPNWTVETMDTGAMPHFEMPAEFVRRYDLWSAGILEGHLDSPDLAAAPPAVLGEPPMRA